MTTVREQKPQLYEMLLDTVRPSRLGFDFAASTRRHKTNQIRSQYSEELSLTEIEAEID